MNTIEIKGDYKQTFEPFHGFRWSHGGPFDLSKDVSAGSLSQQVGPLTVTESIQAGAAVVALSAFGFFQQFQVAKLPQGGLPFKFELDRGNYVEGTIYAK